MECIFYSYKKFKTALLKAAFNLSFMHRCVICEQTASSLSVEMMSSFLKINFHPEAKCFYSEH